MEIVQSILMLLAGCGVFMTGMKLMGDALERSAGQGMRKLFGRISGNRFAGIGVGTAVTAIIQSSSATSVMVIGFVNAGLMTLFQATSIIMGANIGTTVTGILVSLSAFNVSMYLAALSLVGVFIMMFARRDTAKRIGGILAGLGLIFVGLEFMGSAFDGDNALSRAFTSLFSAIDFPLLLILFGAVFTGIIQSSSAATGLIITMVGGGVLELRCALYIVLGSNIGTCVTAILASIGASTNAKRTALIHLTFNVIGTIIFTTFMWTFNDGVIWLLTSVVSTPEMQVAWFHVVFNVVTTILLVPFIKQLTRFAEFVIKDKKRDDEPRLYYIDDRILQTPPIAVAQVLKEVLNMGNLARENLDRAMKAVLTLDVSEKEKILKTEEQINFINKGVARYLIKVSALSLSKSDEKIVGSLHHVISDLERIGDHAENFIEQAEEMRENGIAFSGEARGEIESMYARVTEMFGLSLSVFEERDTVRLKDVSALEAQVDVFKKLFGNSHIERLNKGSCSVESGTYFYAVISALERIADHLTNVAFSIRSPSGSQVEAMQKLAAEAARAGRK